MLYTVAMRPMRHEGERKPKAQKHFWGTEMMNGTSIRGKDPDPVKDI